MTIDPSKIPGLKIDVESIRSGASDLSTQAGNMRSSGSTVKSTWAGMSGCYQAPEQETLYAAMNPVETLSGDLADDLESMASSLGAFADAAEAIKADAVTLQGRAQSFLDTTGADPEWMYDQKNVDAHTDLVEAASALQVRLWDAERECANAIRALDGLDSYHADQRSRDDELFYGMSSIPSDAEGLPWGDAVQRRDHCPAKAGTSLWRGVYNDFVLGTINGLTNLFGVSVGGPEGLSFSVDTAAATWQGMAGLAGFRWDEFGDFEGWSLDNARRSWVAAGQGLVSWDMWKEDPLRALTTNVLNVAMIVATWGAGAAAAGGRAGSAVSRLGRLGRAAAVVDRIMAFMDPLGTVIGVGVSRAGSWVARVTGMRLNLRGLVDAWHRPADVDVPSVEGPGTRPGAGVDVDSVGRIDPPGSGVDAPSAPDAHVPGARAGVDSVASDAHASVGDGSGAPRAHDASVAPDSDAPGAHPGGDAPSAPDAHVPGAHSELGSGAEAGSAHAHGGHAHGGAGTSGSFGAEDGAVPVPGRGSGDDSLHSGAPADGTVPEVEPRHHTLADGSGQPYDSLYSPEQAQAHPTTYDLLREYLEPTDGSAPPITHLDGTGVTLDEIREIAGKPLDELTVGEARLLEKVNDFRNEHMPELLEKIVDPRHVINEFGMDQLETWAREGKLDPDMVRRWKDLDNPEPHYGVDSVGGSVAETSTANADLSTVDSEARPGTPISGKKVELAYGLDYPDSPHTNDIVGDAPSFIEVRFDGAGLGERLYVPDNNLRDVLARVAPDVDPNSMLRDCLEQDTRDFLEANSDRMDEALRPGNPWRGTGFAGAVRRTNIAMPELMIDGRVNLSDLGGAEMWARGADGSQVLLAVAREGRWVVVS